MKELDSTYNQYMSKWENFKAGNSDEFYFHDKKTNQLDCVARLNEDDCFFKFSGGTSNLLDAIAYIEANGSTSAEKQEYNLEIDVNEEPLSLEKFKLKIKRWNSRGFIVQFFLANGMIVVARHRPYGIVEYNGAYQAFNQMEPLVEVLKTHWRKDWEK